MKVQLWGGIRCGAIGNFGEHVGNIIGSKHIGKIFEDDET